MGAALRCVLATVALVALVPAAPALALTLSLTLAQQQGGEATGEGPEVDAPARAQEPPPPAWRTQLELGFNGARGNSSFLVLRTGFSVTHLRTDVAEMDVSGLYRYGKSDGSLIARDWRAGVKLDLHPQGDWTPFVFATASGDAVRRLDLRSEGGAGAKHTFWRGETGKASLSLASLYSYENFGQEAGLSAIEPRRSARWSLRAKGEKRIGQTELQQTSFYQPVWNQAGNFLVEVTSSLSTRLVGDLNLALEHEFLHDAEPPPDVERSDHKLSVMFRYVF